MLFNKYLRKKMEKELKNNEKTLPDWFVHSDNTGGNKNIRQLLINYMYRVEGRLSKMDDAYGYFNGQLIYKK